MSRLERARRLQQALAAAAALAGAATAGATFAHQSSTPQAGLVADAVTADVPRLARGGRYCDIMIVRRDDGDNVIEVWSTQGVSACPDDCEAAFDAKDIKSRTDARRVAINGPRIWLPNSPAPTPPADARRHFGGIEVGLVVTLEAKRGAGDPFKERVVPRKTTNVFKSGEELYELVSPDGDVYVMQSMSLTEDPDLTMDDLSTLDARLKLPRKWSYRARTLEADLMLGPNEDGEVVLLQDRLKNTYQRR